MRETVIIYFLNKLTNIKTTGGENISWPFFKIKDKFTKL